MEIVIWEVSGHMFSLRKMEGIQNGSITTILGKLDHLFTSYGSTFPYGNRMKQEGGTRNANYLTQCQLKGTAYFKDGVIRLRNWQIWCKRSSGRNWGSLIIMASVKSYRCQRS